MRARSLVAGMALLLLLAGCSYQIVRRGRLDLRRFQQVQARVSSGRGLAFVKPVPVKIVSSREARDYLIKELREEMSPAELHNLARIYSRLGFLAGDVDLEQALLELYQDQVAGFYDADEATLFLVGDAMRGHYLIRAASALLRRDLAGEMFLAHELTHALQDQHFNIGKYLKDVKQDDRSLARRAVYEGDATLSGFAALTGHLTEKTLDSVLARLQGVSAELKRTYPGTPPVLRQTLAFQYVQGAEFVAEAWRRGGWKAVDAVVSHPPLSTEQILHWQKYFGSPDLPVEVDFGSFELGEGSWSLQEENTMGELLVLILGRQYLDAAEARRAAEGWDGDRLAAYENGQEICIVWLSAWDTEADAAEFFAAIGAVMGNLRPQAAPLRAKAGEAIISTAASYYIERQGSKVLLLDHAPDNAFEKIADEIWQLSSFRVLSPELNPDLAGMPGISNPDDNPLVRIVEGNHQIPHR